MEDNNDGCGGLTFNLTGKPTYDISTDCITINVTIGDSIKIDGCIPCAEYELYKKIRSLTSDDKKKLKKLMEYIVPIIYNFKGDKENVYEITNPSELKQIYDYDYPQNNTQIHTSILTDAKPIMIITDLSNQDISNDKVDKNIQQFLYKLPDSSQDNYKKEFIKTENILKRFNFYYFLENQTTNYKYPLIIELKKKLKIPMPPSAFGSSKKSKTSRKKHKKSLKRTKPKKSKRSKNKTP